MKQFLEVGEIVGTHGIKGEIRFHPWSDTPAFLKNFKTLYFDNQGTKSIKIMSSRVHGNVVLMILENIDSVEKASALRGKVLFMDRKDAKINKGDYFIQDLIGCKVIDDNDETIVYGTLSDVSRTGANDVWHIKMQDNTERLIPAIKDVVKTIDIENDVVTIVPLKGIFDDED